MMTKKRPKHGDAIIYFRPATSPLALGLYIHIPFCERKCNYCDFYSVCDLKKSERYIDALIKQIEDYKSSAAKYFVDSIYIGGGTPSLLTKKQLARLFKAIKSNFMVKKDAEITCEVNPVSASKKMLKALRKVGVNRLSIGAQSAHDDELKMLGRLHNYQDVCDTVATANKLNFENISLDVMYSLPDQTLEMLMDTLSKFVALEPTHISLYSLKIEDGTPFASQKDTLSLPDEDTDVDMYFKSIDFLDAHGYRQYEISNFAKTGHECRHNLKYWDCDEYLGLGTAAASFFGNKRFTFIKNVDTYCDIILDGADEPIICEEIDAPMKESIGDYVMLRFRLNEGIRFADFSKRFMKRDFEEIFGARLAPFVKRDLVVKDEFGYRFNRKGFYVSNYILSSILDFKE